MADSEGPAGIEVTNVRVIPFDTTTRGGKTLAYAEVVFNGVLRVRGFQIVATKSGGLFVGYPSRRATEGRYHETVSALDAELKSQIREAILAAFREHAE